MKEATIVFDLDGTLVDTAPDLINATNHILTHINQPPVDSLTARTWISHGARYMIKQALNHAKQNLDEPEVDELLDLFLAHYTENIARESRPFPGVLNVLDRLHNQGARLCVCTNKREGLARSLLEELKMLSMFHALAGRDTLPTCKPDAGHVLGTIEMAGGNPHRAIMVGDSSNDIEAAKAAHIPSIAVTFGYSKHAPTDLGADILIDHFDKLEHNLKSLLKASTKEL